jgi:hypothetical protein
MTEPIVDDEFGEASLKVLLLEKPRATRAGKRVGFRVGVGKRARVPESKYMYLYYGNECVSKGEWKGGG